MPAATLASLLLAASNLSAADRAAIDATVLSMYQPYSRGGSAAPVWEQPLFSAEVSALIAHWQRVIPKDEPDRLNDGDWLCLCQDWEAGKFRMTIGAHRRLRANVAQVQVSLDLGTNERRNLRFVFNREGRSWKLDNIYGRGGFENGLKTTLRQTIAEDEKLPR